MNAHLLVAHSLQRAVAEPHHGDSAIFVAFVLVVDKQASLNGHAAERRAAAHQMHRRIAAAAVDRAVEHRDAAARRTLQHRLPHHIGGQLLAVQVDDHIFIRWDGDGLPQRHISGQPDAFALLQRRSQVLRLGHIRYARPQVLSGDLNGGLSAIQQFGHILVFLGLLRSQPDGVPLLVLLLQQIAVCPDAGIQHSGRLDLRLRAEIQPQAGLFSPGRTGGVHGVIVADFCFARVFVPVGGQQRLHKFFYFVLTHCQQLVILENSLVVVVLHRADIDRRFHVLPLARSNLFCCDELFILVQRAVDVIAQHIIDPLAAHRGIRRTVRRQKQGALGHDPVGIAAIGAEVNAVRRLVILFCRGRHIEVDALLQLLWHGGLVHRHRDLIDLLSVVGHGQRGAGALPRC